ncbi:MAG: hypothetical protein L3J39_18095 [Verrucomicrobiales bacterium]|nr:hypothetical protein [Verrucomicrobiales bacterium]
MSKKNERRMSGDEVRVTNKAALKAANDGAFGWLIFTGLLFYWMGCLESGFSIEPKRSDAAIKLSIGVTGSLQNPSGSPDSQSLLFTRWRKKYNEGAADLFIYDLKRGVLRELMSDSYANVNLPGSSWNPKTNKIVFSSDREPHDEIFMIDPKGKTGDELRITSQKRRMSYEASFSPDGEWVVFETHPRNVERSGVITKCLVEGKGEAKDYLALTDRRGDCRQPNWSPAGDLILYQKKERKRWDIWVMNADGSNQRKLTSGIGSKTDASFSPDGKWIVYSSDGQGELRFANIYVTRISDGKTLRVTQYEGYDGAPTWLANGKSICFESTAGDPDESKGATLWSIELALDLK